MGIRQDFRHPLRQVRRNPVVFCLTSLLLALVTTSNTTVFSVINAFTFRPLPFPAPQRLMFIWHSKADRPNDLSPLSPANYLDIANRNRVFEVLAAYRSSDVNLSGDAEPRQLFAAIVSPSVFQSLGAKGVLGRVFVEEDGSPGAEPVVLLAHSFVQRLGGMTDMIGRRLLIDNAPHTVVGVLPRQFELFDAGIDIWLPYTLEPTNPERKERRIAFAVGLLKAGVSPEEARSDLQQIGLDLSREYPEANYGYDITALTIREAFPGHEDRTLFELLQGACLLVLVVACINVGGALLAHCLKRTGEFALRTALGAGSYRISRQVLFESISVAGLGSAMGIVLSLTTIASYGRALKGVVPDQFLPVFDWRVFTFSLSVAILSGVVCSLAPVLRSARIEPASALKGGSELIFSKSRGSWSWLLTAEIALTIALLWAAGLFTHRFLALAFMPGGFRTTGMLTFDVRLPQRDYPQRRVVRFSEQLLEAVSSQPRVEGVTAASTLPRAWDTPVTDVGVPGWKNGGRSDSRLEVSWLCVAQDYFGVMEIPLLAGRAFGVEDREDGTPVAIVDQRLAELLRSQGEVLGQRIIMLGRVREIVGVAAIVTQRRLGDFDGIHPLVYLPWTQHPSPTISFLVSSALEDPTTLVPSIRQAVRAVDPRIPLADVMPLEEFIAKQYVGIRIFGAIVWVLSAIVFCLATLGSYGNVALSAVRRRKEVAIRFAFGATPLELMHLFLKDGLRVASVGLAVALPMAAFVHKVFLGTWWPSTDEAVLLGGVVGCVASVTLLASFVPLRPIWRGSVGDLLRIR